MSQEWIGLDTQAKLMNWCWTAFLTAIFATMAWIVATKTEQPDLWWVVGAIALCWLAAVVYMVNRCYGRTLLTAEGMEFHTFFSHRKVRWADVTRIDRRSHQVRGGEWWDVHAIRRQGRSLRVPGAHTTNPRDAGYQRKLRRIRKYWTAATKV